MPAGITELDLCQYGGSLNGVRWPASLTKLTAGSCCAAARRLPDSLLELHLDRDPDSPWLLPLADVCLPPSLTALTLGGGFIQPLAEWRPPEGLRELGLGHQWDRPVSGLRLPPRLQRLTFGDGFDQPVDQLDLPPALTELHFGMGCSRFRQPLSGLRLPPSLRVLSLPSFGRRPCGPALLAPPAALPPSLRELRVHADAVRFDLLAAWDLPPRCVIRAVGW